MSQTPGAPTMVLRLSVPATGEFPQVAADLAVKVAEHLGRPAADARATSDTIQGLVLDVAPDGGAGQSAGGSDITFEFHQVNGELRIEARCEGRSSAARHPLPT
jgi:hypothetical protein